MQKSNLYTWERLTGRVITGNQIGRTIGFPTANISVKSEKLMLVKGVYGVKVLYNEMMYHGIMNVGTRPTINKTDAYVHYEVHLFQFNEMIYGETLEVEICFFIREEMSFSVMEQLVAQITQDIHYTESQFQLYQTS